MAVPTRVAVVGGGLAGLSVSYHLSHACHVTIIDPCRVGCGGASAVAGGYVLYSYTCVVFVFGQG